MTAVVFRSFTFDSNLNPHFGVGCIGDTVYLTRAYLSPSSPLVHRILEDPDYAHKTVMSLFPRVSAGQPPRDAFGVLYRLERAGNCVSLTIQSDVAPSTSWPAGYLRDTSGDTRPSFTTKEVHLGVANGQRLVFLLHGNTTRKLANRRHLLSPEDSLRWLDRQAEQSGFEVDHGTLDACSLPMLGGLRSVGGTRFEGVLTIKDTPTLLGKVRDGIGPAKAFGFGLLSLKPLR